MSGTKEDSSEVIPSRATKVCWVYPWYDEDGSDGEDDSDDEDGSGDQDRREEQEPSVGPAAPAEPSPKETPQSERSLGNTPDGREKIPEPDSNAADQPNVDTNPSAPAEKLRETGAEQRPAPEETYVGKWMLFFDQVERDEQGLTMHDRAWFKVAPLCRDGRLYDAKASTAKKDPMAHTANLGCICCYTRDYRDLEEVRKKGDLVRIVLEEELRQKVIYYKTDSATQAMKYRILGSGRVSIYRHKPDYTFWKTSEDNTSWDMVHPNRRFNNRFGTNHWRR